MACGLPCIVTSYGGQLTFATSESVFLLDVKRMCPLIDDAMSHQPGIWGFGAEPDWDHLTRLMRHVVENPEVAAAKGKAARLAACRWSWDHAAEVALATLEESGAFTTSR
jgi:hypothetical protein